MTTKHGKSQGNKSKGQRAISDYYRRKEQERKRREHEEKKRREREGGNQ